MIHGFKRILLGLLWAPRVVCVVFSVKDIEGCVDPQDRIFIVQSRPQAVVSSVPLLTQWFCWSLSLWKMASYHWE